MNRPRYRVLTAYDLPDGEQMEVEVGFDIEPRERMPYGRGSPDIPASVIVLEVTTPTGEGLDFDALTPEQQRQLVGACEAELDARNR